MRILKSQINTIIGVLLLALTTLNVFLCCLGYAYAPYHPIVLWMIGVIAVGGSTFFSAKYRKEASKAARIFGCLMPVLVHVFLISFFWNLYDSTDSQGLNPISVMVLFVLGTVSSWVIFFYYQPIRWVRICAIIFLVLYTHVVAYISFFVIIFGGIGAKNVLKTVSSPQGTYVAYSVDHDQGALGGATYVYVRNQKKDIHLLTGTLKQEEKSIWSAGWGVKPTLQWADESHLLIDGQVYEVNE